MWTAASSIGAGSASQAPKPLTVPSSLPQSSGAVTVMVTGTTNGLSGSSLATRSSARYRPGVSTIAASKTTSANAEPVSAAKVPVTGSVMNHGTSNAPKKPSTRSISAIRSSAPATSSKSNEV